MTPEELKKKQELAIKYTRRFVTLFNAIEKRESLERSVIFTSMRMALISLVLLEMVTISTQRGASINDMSQAVDQWLMNFNQEMRREFAVIAQQLIEMMKAKGAAESTAVKEPPPPLDGTVH